MLHSTVAYFRHIVAIAGAGVMQREKNLPDHPSSQWRCDKRHNVSDVKLACINGMHI